MDAIASDDCYESVWRPVFTRLAEHLRAHAVPEARTVVLLPFAQLLPWAQRFWARWQPEGFAPRFATTRSWARTLAAWVPAAGDFTGEAARDVLTARSLLERAGLGSERALLAAPLQEAAAQLAPAVAAVPPPQRAAWGEHARSLLPTPEASQPLRYEAAVARIALEWVLASSHPTDVLFTPAVRAVADALVLLEGLQPDPLAQALCAYWNDSGGTPALVLQLQKEELLRATDDAKPRIAVHAASDGEDEAQRAAACVLARLGACRTLGVDSENAPQPTIPKSERLLVQGRTRVALGAIDRALTRRIRAQLEGAGVAVRDETGWTLSTTRAAAQTMALLQACAWDAASDAVLDALKQASAVDGATRDAFERILRADPAPRWRSVVARDWSELPPQAELVAAVERWRARLHAARPLADWLRALRELLQASGLWAPFEGDAAGALVLQALRLHEALQLGMDDWDGAAQRLTLAEFTRWADAVLEAARYVPPAPEDARVVVLPLAQLLARPFDALVLPGCDEKRLPAAPEPLGPWSEAQRSAWGLPTRAQLAAAQRAAWRTAMQLPAADLLWRSSDEGGEPLLPSPLLQALQCDGVTEPGVDARCAREVCAAPTLRPAPSAAPLPVRKLSASMYADLRACPYRFFALRQLGVQEVGELEAEIDKRDFGSWLHLVLQHFHERLRDAPASDTTVRMDLLDAAAQSATAQLGLDAGGFLPFAATWPQLRAGYLRWLAQHEEQGAVFLQAELALEQALDEWRLVGKLDRVDEVAESHESPEAPEVPEGAHIPFVIDYKTESATKTRQRIADGAEDTQLAFYAALLGAERLRAAYVNVGERGETATYEQQDVLALRTLLRAGIRSDLGRIAAGAPLPALGEGPVCDFCAARGLCRKDFWQ
ncbi:PD-(D/E)XK nuclease family protein [Extensimonas sp. H3M7-6]|uniref:PD-(D/E)XK nuclease family protein n=1 Tax=Extensimonas soli TaxID=3031322 RepID=UPI00387E98D2